MTLYADGQIPYQVRRRYLKGLGRRVWELDFLRGICVLLMVLDHMAMLVSEYFSYTWYGYGWSRSPAGVDGFTAICHDWIYSPYRDIAHNIVLFVFFALCGISCYFSRSNLRRGAGLAVVSILYSLCTLFVQDVLGIPGTLVTYGVLNFLATAILIYVVIEFVCKKDMRAISTVCLGLIAIVLTVYFFYTPPEDTPEFWHFMFHFRNIFGEMYDFYSPTAVSPGDHFAIIPYLAYFLAGPPIAMLLYPERRSLLPKLDRGWKRPICFVGRHALVAYVAHMVALAGFFALLTYLVITPGNWGL